MKAETRFKKIMMIENEKTRKHKLFEFIFKVVPQSPIQEMAKVEYFKIK